jgi:REP element-mobilizing transposase RayT
MDNSRLRPSAFAAIPCSSLRISIALNTFLFYVVTVTDFFDPFAKVNVQRRKLPHWNQGEVIYFVTFRLADSLPIKKLEALKEEKTQWLVSNPPPRDERQVKEYHRLFSRRIHEWLDAGHGSCILARPDIYRMVEGALNFFNGQRYALGEHVVMPNHVHALVQPLGNHEINRIFHSWKSYSAKEINKMLGSHGSVWHRESFDRIVRSPAQLSRIEEYIRDNPNSLPLDQRPETQ